MECKKCGNTLRNGENFCTVCGYYNDWKAAREEEKAKLDVDFDEEDDFFSTEDKKEIIVEEDFPVEHIEVETLLPYYVGDDYDFLQQKKFNWNACLLNWVYFLYRRLYWQGIIGLILSSLAIVFLNFYSMIIFVIVCPILGYSFNSYYLKIAKRRVEKIQKKNPRFTQNALETECKKKGKPVVILTLLLYAIFLAGTVFGIVTYTKNNLGGRYKKVNQENRLDCLNYLRTVYKDVERNPQYVYITEGTCSITNTTTTYYDIYLKGTESNHNVYFYYSTATGNMVLRETTEDKIEYDVKQKEGTITEEEKKILERLQEVENNYDKIYHLAEQSARKKDKEIARNFVFSREEIVR